MSRKYPSWTVIRIGCGEIYQTSWFAVSTPGSVDGCNQLPVISVRNGDLEDVW